MSIGTARLLLLSGARRRPWLAATRHCAKADGSMNKGTLAFVDDGKTKDATKHALVMPNKPCRGVEVWDDENCGREAIWEAAYNRYPNPSSKYFVFGLAVNSMHRRTEAQLHLHIGNLATSFKDALQAGRKWAGTTQKSFKIGCTKTSTGTISCTFDKDQQAKYKIFVTIATGSKPSDAAPFKTVYGKPSMPPNTATIYHSMAVVPSAEKEWLIIALTNSPAECIFADSFSQSKCGTISARRAGFLTGSEDASAPPAAIATGTEEVTSASSGTGPPTDAADAAVAPASISDGVPGRRMKL